MSREKWEIHGVYEILNLENGKRYIGSAAGKQGIEGRLEQHASKLSTNRHPNRHLQNAWNVHGKSAFALRSIFHCSAKDCIEFEQRHIDQFPWSALYNLAPKAGSVLGVKFSEEARKANSIRMKAMTADPEWRAQSSVRMKAITADPEWKAKHSARMKIVNADPEWKAQQSARMKVSCADPELKAQQSARAKAMHADPERKAKISARTKVMGADPEWKAQHSARMKVLWSDPAFRERMVTIRRNRKRSEIPPVPLQP